MKSVPPKSDFPEGTIFCFDGDIPLAIFPGWLKVLAFDKAEPRRFSARTARSERSDPFSYEDWVALSAEDDEKASAAA